MNARLFEKLSQVVDGQMKLAEHLGISAKTVSAWKVRSTPPPVKHLPKIVEFLGVSVEWLMTGKEATQLLAAPVNGIGFGNNHGTMNFGNGKTCALSAEAVELVRIFEALGYKQRRQIMDMATAMENKEEDLQ